MIVKLNYFIKKHALLIVMCIAIVSAVSLTIYYFHKGDILAYNDARSHVDIARRVIDNKTPGIAQFGGTWLPLPQILMVPFVANYTLWHTGLAGSFVSMFSYVVAAIFMYKIIFLLTKREWVGILAALLLIFNPNIMYMQSTPMTELLLIATMLFGSYFFIKWLYSNETKDLLLASFGVFLATLVRYEGWFVLLVCASIIILNSVLLRKSKKTGEGQSVLFLTLGTFGIALWVLWNLLIWGNPIYFLDGGSSASAQQSQLAAAGQLPTKGHIITSLTTITQASYLNVGKITFVVGILALIFVIYKARRNRNIIFAILILAAPFLLDYITLVLGITTIRVSWATMFNIRYGVMVVPLIAAVVALAVNYIKIPNWSKLIVGLIVVIVGLNATVVTLYDPTHGSSGTNQSLANYRNVISKDYKGGNILASVQTFDPVMQELGFPLKNYIHEGNYHIWDKTLIDPENAVAYVMMQKGGSGAGVDLVYKDYLKRT
jgi:hypothetical protein